MTQAIALASKKIIGFMDTVEKLCHVKRYTLMQNGENERDSDHIMKLSFLAMMIAPYLKKPLDTAKMFELVLVHDLVEADAGDVPVFDQMKNPDLKAEKKKRELAAIERYRAMLPAPLGDKVYDLFMEYEKKETFEARLVRALDKFEGNIQCNKENFGARYYAQALTPVMNAMKSHKFSGSLDEEVISAIETELVSRCEKNIEHCRKKGLI